MGLIDADELKRRIAGMAIADNYPADQANKMCGLIDCQPTAYDVDKAVEQIGSSSKDEDGIICYMYGKPVITKEVETKIIKLGGIE